MSESIPLSAYPDRPMPDRVTKRAAAMQTIGDCLIRAMQDSQGTPGAAYYTMPAIGRVDMNGIACSWLHETVHDFIQQSFGYTVTAAVHQQNNGQCAAFDIRVTNPEGELLASFASSALTRCPDQEVQLVAARAHMLLDGWFPEPFMQ